MTGVSAMTAFDHIVVGQGLAGTCLAWALRWQGRSVLVIDRDDPVTSSKIAAGLVTPVTGKRLVKTWRLDDLLPAAVRFYRRAEADTGATFFAARPQLRLFADDRERAVYATRAAEFAGWVRDPDPPPDPGWFAADLGGYELAPAYQLATTRFLAASRDVFTADGGYRVATVDASADVDVTADGVRLPRLGVVAAGLTFCTGYAAAGNPWFPGLAFNSAKGEILTLRISGLAEPRVVNRGVWLAGLGGDLFRAGSTYDHGTHDEVPTPAARDEILARLREFVRLPVTVVGHDAAVRPIIRVKYPTLGVSPRSARVGMFNGLASKGSLVAPYFAEQYAAELCGAGTLDAEERLR